MNAIKLYRIGNWCYRKRIPFIPILMKGLTFLIYNSVVPYATEIGKQSKLAYGGMSVVIHSKAIIGERVIIGQNTTIGRALDPSGVPKIGDDVYISAGARLVGDIVVGNNVIIGANAVVTKSVPDNSIVAGVPAKVLREVEESIWALLENIY